MPSSYSTATTVAAIAVGCSLLAYGSSRLSRSMSSSSTRPKTDLADLDDVDDDDVEDFIAPDDVVTVFDKLFMTMQQVIMQLSQQVQQIQMSGQVIPERQLRQLLKAEFERALIACQDKVFEDNNVDADCLEEATWEFMERPEQYPKVKRAVERFQKLYESISGEDVVGWTPRSDRTGGGGSDEVGYPSSAVARKDLTPVELMTAATLYFDAITKSMIELSDAWKAAGRDFKDPGVVTQFQLEASTDANEAGEEKLESEMGITMSDFRSAIDRHSRIPSVGQTLGMLQMKQQQELIAAGVPM
ncbi:hypothetical protein ACHAXA_011709 [Cyclostephanos tholiformis]|jgi:hypothetical protein|uniref:Uncharacterized protein n=1 Tax=Cyclostephanos tholiformis TaxID=382380 RepID=A0ABD3R0M9_9STRA